MGSLIGTPGMQPCKAKIRDLLLSDLANEIRVNSQSHILPQINQEKSSIILCNRMSKTQIGKKNLKLKNWNYFFFFFQSSTAAAKKTLPDFLDEQHQFQNLLVLSQSPEGKPPTLLKVPKSQALEGYVQRKPTVKGEKESDTGYDPL